MTARSKKPKAKNQKQRTDLKGGRCKEKKKKSAMWRKRFKE